MLSLLVTHRAVATKYQLAKLEDGREELGPVPGRVRSHPKRSFVVPDDLN
jgi:hypothetical protein